MTAVTTVDRVAAILDIHALKARYFRGVDTKDWTMLRAVFTPDARLTILEMRPEPLTVEEFFEAVPRTLQKVVSIHHGHMPEIEILSADTARGIWAMEDELFAEGAAARDIGFAHLHGYGHYHEEYQRRDGRWLIHGMKLTRLRKNVVIPPQSFT